MHSIKKKLFVTVGYFFQLENVFSLWKICYLVLKHLRDFFRLLSLHCYMKLRNLQFSLENLKWICNNLFLDEANGTWHLSWCNNHPLIIQNKIISTLKRLWIWKPKLERGAVSSLHPQLIFFLNFNLELTSIWQFWFILSVFAKENWLIKSASSFCMCNFFSYFKICILGNSSIAQLWKRQIIHYILYFDSQKQKFHLNYVWKFC